MNVLGVVPVPGGGVTLARHSQGVSTLKAERRFPIARVESTPKRNVPRHIANAAAQLTGVASPTTSTWLDRRWNVGSRAHANGMRRPFVFSVGEIWGTRRGTADSPGVPPAGFEPALQP